MSQYNVHAYLSEEEIKQYFVRNGGAVKNTEIVSHFRPYLSNPNPSIREEARILFKGYVNKLATVNLEKGEKMLVLKRQYFPPIDGNGNVQSRNPGPQYNPLLQSTMSQSVPTDDASQPSRFMPPISNPHQSNPHNYNKSSMPFDNHQAIQRRHSGSLYGSAYSLNSNYGDKIVSPPRTENSIRMNQPNYLSSNAMQLYQNNGPTSSNYMNFPSSTQINSYQGANQLYGNYGDVGLPAAPISVGNGPVTNSPHLRLRLNSPTSPTTCYPQSPVRNVPPPYRPPPPPSAGVSRRSSLSGGGYSPGTMSRAFFPPEASKAGLYHRSASVTGLSGSANSSAIGQSLQGYPLSPGCSKNLSKNPFGSSPGAPAPPVPPRSKRSNLERSLSSAAQSNSSFQGPSTLSSCSEYGDQNFGTASSSVASPSGSTARRTKRNVSKEVDEYGNKNRSRGSRNTMVSHAKSAIDLRQEGPSVNEIEYEKENFSFRTNDGKFLPERRKSEGALVLNAKEAGVEDEKKISVKERTQKFDRIASQSEIGSLQVLSNKTQISRPKKESNGNGRHDSADSDTASLSSYVYGYSQDPKAKVWMMNSVNCDFEAIQKMSRENPELIKRKDIYTALHWAAKQGHVELVTFLANYGSDVNSKSNGGYTPLHLAAQFSKQEVYDLLQRTYGADPNIRDHSGKKPMQYLAKQENSSMTTMSYKKIKDRRKQTTDKDSSFLRIGSLNVKVKSTTKEAFGYFLGRTGSTSNIEKASQKRWGSAENLPENELANSKDKQMMPPPSTLPSSRPGRLMKKRYKRGAPSSSHSPVSTRSNVSDSDSDTAAGFGSGWNGA